MGRRLSERTLFAFFYGISTIHLSYAEYCEWGLCDSWQVCCGDNECCDMDKYNTFYIGAGICFGLFLLIVCCKCFFRWWYYRRGQGLITTGVSTTSYMTLPTAPDSHSVNYPHAESPVTRCEMPVDWPRHPDYPPPYPGGALDGANKLAG